MFSTLASTTPPGRRLAPPEPETGARVGRRCDTNLPALRLDQFLDQRQANARPFDPVARVERLKNPPDSFLIFGRHPRPVVGDGELPECAGIPGFDVDVHARSTVLDRVADQVLKDLPQRR